MSAGAQIVALQRRVAVVLIALAILYRHACAGRLKDASKGGGWRYTGWGAWAMR